MSEQKKNKYKAEVYSIKNLMNSIKYMKILLSFLSKQLF